jgi:AraC-like DNA-binding protein
VRSVQQYPYHWHDTLEIMQVLKGTVNVGIGDDELLFRENDIAVVNIGELHHINKSNEDNEILFAQVDPGFYRDLLQDKRYLFIYCCSAYHGTQVPEKYEKLKGYIACLMQAFIDRSHKNYIKNVKNILADMLSNITYNFDFLRWGYGTVPFDERCVERLRQIAEHTRSEHEVNMGLKDMAAELGISLQHLSNDIKNKFGSTFTELLCYGKCEQAAKLLLSTDARIIDIAMECRFSDVKYLIKHFKKYFRYTPSEFRRMYRAHGEKLASQARYSDLPICAATKILEKMK